MARPLFVVLREAGANGRHVRAYKESATARSPGAKPVPFRCVDDDGEFCCFGRVWLHDDDHPDTVFSVLEMYAASVHGATRLWLKDGPPDKYGLPTWQIV